MQNYDDKVANKRNKRMVLIADILKKKDESIPYSPTRIPCTLKSEKEKRN